MDENRLVPPQLPAVGDLIDGKYVIDCMVGRGGMGVVMRAVHRQLEQRVAIKFLLPEGMRSTAAARFVREARAASRIQSEHVARVVDVNTLPNGLPYMVMEYLTGEDLQEVATKEAPLAVATVGNYILQACEALAEAHAMGLVHRDLKPANLFRTWRKDGSPFIKVLDFGIAKDVADQNLSMTATGQSIGSPYYMSPEQVRDAKKVDQRSDIWSLGVILYELLSGQTPFGGDTLGGVFAAIVSDPYVSIRTHRRDVPLLVEQILARALERDVKKRFQTVGEFANALAGLDPNSHELLSRILKVERAPGSRVSGSAGPMISLSPPVVPGTIPDAPVSGMELTQALPGSAPELHPASISMGTGPIPGMEKRGNAFVATVVAIGLATGLAVGIGAILWSQRQAHGGAPQPTVTAVQPSHTDPIASAPPTASATLATPASVTGTPTVPPQHIPTRVIIPPPTARTPGSTFLPPDSRK
jgi:eukaryotic-like serine/threonine-protein kinase